ncbi:MULTISPECIES: DUF3718 domain-containing protein [unclassified Pseudoalteromonas]|uniref:DUF3718 domain-containing protein n=1 Tax=unclassified Pseudoalteromonas TaxID=194690 RepID=UPI0011092113|nr:MULTISPECIES: DUF3718 domain-containing protein [unclassified Pseudoalteromonas]MBW4965553.1 DUF3718 domain-containing protein [Pseudoalteromonas sp. CR1]TMN81257.1 hypothetical protein CWB64_11830 [Pseudoalteromonas sp. S410]TMN89238.1 hypothetical protein CWB62_12820 [Pseudoalteromonas sp. S408]TMN95016.1 hypothetical protein CWB61_15715 [Pseudoalteromonas sp. S407]TMO00686.1 hypothetical protein CWB63_06375 [Pseudoalteromonas sp. S409]|tara:strand:+ start:279 stop:641 length:363 start_codon:yes stop_codon:yes gene_type:complete
MNTVKKALCTTLVIGSAALAAPVSAAQFVAADSTPGTQICMAVASNKAYVLRKAQQSLNVKKSIISNKLTCNNLPMGDFVARYNLDKSANYLNIESNTRTSIKDLANVSLPDVVVISSPQ